MSFWKNFGSGKLRECEENARREPDNPQFHFELGTEYEQRGKYPEAIEAFEQTLKLSPRSAETHFNLGVLYETTGKTVAKPSSTWYRRVICSPSATI